MRDNYNILIRSLDDFIRKFYKNQLVKGAIYSVALLAAFYLSIALLEFFGHFGTTIRTILFYLFVGSSLYILIKLVAVPFMKMRRLGAVISYEQAAEIIGKHFSNIEDKLLNVLQLKKAAASEDSELLRASIEQKVEELKPVPFASAIDFSKNKRYARYALIPVSAFLFILVAAPSVLTESSKRIVQHDRFFAEPAPFQFKIENTSLKASEQEDFNLNVKLSGVEIPSEVFIEIGNTHFRLSRENAVKFKYLFKNLQKSVRFRLFANGWYSDEFELSVNPQPAVLDFEARLEYPAYLQKKPEIVQNTGDLTIPSGTKISWSFSTRNADKIVMTYPDTTYSLSPAGENSFRFTRRILNSQNYSVKTHNRFGSGKDSLSYSLTVIPDQYPAIEASQKFDSLSPKQYFFSGRAKDDYGLKRLLFHYMVQRADGEKAQGGVHEISIDRSQLQQFFVHQMNFGSLELNPGDEVEYYFEVWDNDGVTGSKSSRTEKMFFKAPTLKELAEQTEKNNSNIKSDLEKSIKEARSIQKDLNDLNKKILEKQNLSWEEKKKMQDLLDRQKELQKHVEHIQNKTEQNFNNQKEFSEPSESLLQKQEQLEELMEKVLTDEMKKLMQEMEKLMEKLSKDKLQEKMDQMKLDNKDLEKELDRALEQFKQLEVEQKIEETTKRLEELAKDQQKLAEQTEQKLAPKDELKARQDELQKEFQDLKKELDDLEKKNSELENPQKLPDMGEKQEQVDLEMKKSSENLQDNKQTKSAQNQKNAAQKMQEMAEQMKQAQQQNQQQQSSEDMNALRDILENLIKVSFDQESTMETLKKTDRQNPLYVKLGQTQKKIKDDAKMIEDSLFALSKRVPQIDALINREISAINQGMEKAIKHIAERQTPQATSRQQQVMTAVNNLSLLLSEALQQMQQQMQQQKSGSAQSCNKPGSTAPKPSAGNMKQMQAKINQQIEKLKQQMEKEGQQKGQSKPGQKGQGGMSEELVKLAAQQEALRQQLRKLADELNKDGKGGGSNLDKLAKKMEETETDLVNKRITNETLKRQQEILTRLLEAEKAEREREKDQKRESNNAEDLEQIRNEKFLEYQKMKQKESELLKTVPPALHPFYKNKVNEYFNKIQE